MQETETIIKELFEEHREALADFENKIPEIMKSATPYWTS